MEHYICGTFVEQHWNVLLVEVELLHLKLIKNHSKYISSFNWCLTLKNKITIQFIVNVIVENLNLQ